jgi:hypothetical protein
MPLTPSANASDDSRFLGERWFQPSTSLAKDGLRLEKSLLFLIAILVLWCIVISGNEMVSFPQPLEK